MNTSGIAKSFATGVIWTLCVGLSISSIIVSDGNFGFGTVLVVLVPLLFALIATLAIWVGNSQHSTSDAGQSREYEKAKRGAASSSQLDMLLDMMDDDERDAFKESLKRRVLNNMRLSDEGELPVDLDGLFDEPSKQLRR